jgi:hypothetical protein
MDAVHTASPICGRVKLPPIRGSSWRASSPMGSISALTRMAEACSIASLSQLAWTADWHIRDETYALALRRLINQQQREPLAAEFGSGDRRALLTSGR